MTVPKAPFTIVITFMSHSFFHSLARSKYLSFFSHSLNYTLWSACTARFTILQFFYYYKIWSSGRDLVICLYVKIAEEFVCLLLSDIFWVVHIPFVRTVKLQLIVIIFYYYFTIHNVTAIILPYKIRKEWFAHQIVTSTSSTLWLKSGNEIH